MVRKILTVCSAVMLLDALGGTSVQAKPAEPEPQGIQAGGFVLHPGANVAVGFDSRGSQGHDDGFVDLGAHFKTRLAEEEQYSWDNSIAFKWRQFWGGGDAKPDGNPEVSVSTAADVFKTSFFRIMPNASYSYHEDPEDENLRKDYTNHHLRAGVGMYLQPSGGAVFSQRIGYLFDCVIYSDYPGASYMTNKVDSVTRWNFFPQTSMALTVDFRAIIYFEDRHEAIINPSGADTSNYSSFPIRLTYSLQGLLLSRLSYVIGAGYAYENHTNKNNEHMFIMNARLRYDFSENVGLFVEYRKDFDNVIFGDYYKFHRVSLGFESLWLDSIMLKINASYGNFDFRSLDTARKDNMVTASAALYYIFMPGMKLGLDYVLRFNSSDTDGGSYVKNFVMLNFAYEY